MNENLYIICVQFIDDIDSMKTVKFVMHCVKKWNKKLNWIP